MTGFELTQDAVLEFEGQPIDMALAEVSPRAERILNIMLAHPSYTHEQLGARVELARATVDDICQHKTFVGVKKLVERNMLARQRVAVESVFHELCESAHSAMAALREIIEADHFDPEVRRKCAMNVLDLMRMTPGSEKHTRPQVHVHAFAGKGGAPQVVSREMASDLVAARDAYVTEAQFGDENETRPVES